MSQVLLRKRKLNPSASKFLCIGNILGAHGLKGSVFIYSHTRPAKAIAEYEIWHLGKHESALRAYPIQRCWQHGKNILANIEGIASRNDAEALKGLSIYIPKETIDCDDDEFLWDDLLGCSVINNDGESLGEVCSIECYGAQDTLSVRSDKGEWLIPFTEAIVESIDLDQQQIKVCLPEGMDACFTPSY